VCFPFTKEELMLFVIQLRFHSHLSREQRDGALMRRAQWQYPNNMKVLGEYWPVGNDPAVLVIAETADYEPLMEISLNWSDLFDIRVTPAIDPVAGAQLGAAIMQRRQS
jgi:hypothetical protein